jgi:hypothetical protein
VKVNESGVMLLMATAGGLEDPTGPNVAVVELRKSDPRTVTLCPPPPGPDAGVSDAIAGPANVYRPAYVSQHVFAAHPVSPSVSSESTQTSVGWVESWTAAE